jgi:hypothetical protein
MKRIGLFLFAVGFAQVGTAYAAIPNGGVITGCYQKNAGALRVIDTTVTNCKSNETRLEWNIKGEKGDPGKDGTDGINGNDGTNGTDGVSGYEVVELVEAIGSGGSFIGAFGAGCPSGKRPIGGGMRQTSGSVLDLTVVQSYPINVQGFDFWMTDFRAGSTTNLELTFYTVCVIAP